MKTPASAGFRVSEVAGRRRPAAPAGAGRPPVDAAELPLIHRRLALPPAEFQAELGQLTTARGAPALRRGLAAAAETLADLYRRRG